MNRLLALSCLFLSVAAAAQTDSAYFDAGSLMLKKEFTHHITVKGDDLERMPFRSLQEAVNVYLSGVYTNTTYLVYVVDGIQTNNADVYSIHDIESISFILDAQADLSLHSGSAVLVIINTRQHSGRRKGITLAGSSYLLDRRFADKDQQSSTAPDFFHQYYLSANQQWKKLSFGASANILRDVMPTAKQESAVKQSSEPFRLTRFRFNGWLSYQLHPKHTLVTRVSYMPQKEKSNEELVTDPFNRDVLSEFRNRENGNLGIFNASIQLKSGIGKNWTNLLAVSYMNTNAWYDNDGHTSAPLSPGNPNSETFVADREHARWEQYMIRENIRYTWQWNDLRVVPSLDVQYNYSFLKDIETHYSGTVPLGDGTGLFPTQQFSQVWTGSKSEYYTFTPGLSLEYRNLAAISGGFRKYLPTGVSSSAEDVSVLPFMSGSVNLWQLIDPASAIQLSLYGSYAEMLPGLTVQEGSTARELLGQQLSLGSSSGPLVMPDINDKKKDRSWQAGAKFSLAGGRLSVDYNYQDLTYYYSLIVQFPGYPFYSQLPVKMHSSIYRIGLGTQLSAGSFGWRTGINTSTRKQELTGLGADSSSGPNFGLVLPASKRGWTGGWTNHFTFRRFTAGFNILYFFNEQVEHSFIFPPTWYQANTFLLQQVHAGITMTGTRAGDIELYLSGRNIWQSKKAAYTMGEIKFYGIGASLKW